MKNAKAPAAVMIVPKVSKNTSICAVEAVAAVVVRAMRMKNVTVEAAGAAEKKRNKSIFLAIE